MNSILSEEELKQALADLKHALAFFASPAMQKITFLSLDSLLHYASNIPHNALPILLERVSPYIPLAVTGQHIEAFLSAALRSDEETILEMENSFIYDSKIKFINSIFAVKSEAEWQEIVSICCTVRECKEENLQHTSLQSVT